MLLLVVLLVSIEVRQVEDFAFLSVGVLAWHVGRVDRAIHLLLADVMVRDILLFEYLTNLIEIVRLLEVVGLRVGTGRVEVIRHRQTVGQPNLKRLLPSQSLPRVYGATWLGHFRDGIENSTLDQVCGRQRLFQRRGACSRHPRLFLDITDLLEHIGDA